MGGFERGIADVFATLQGWLVTTGATQSMVRLAWAVLTFLWLGHVAASMRPGCPPDVVGTFGRLVVAGGLLGAVGSLNRVIVLAFEALRDAGSAVLAGLIGQSWHQFFRESIAQSGVVFQMLPWLSWPWALGLLFAGILIGVLLFAVGYTVYLAILFFAHLTLLLALFLAPLALALLATPGTARWTGRWAVVIVKTALVVFSVRVIHAAVIYLAVIVPVRQASAGLAGGFRGLGSNPNNVFVLGVLLLNLVWLLVLMIVGTGVGVYAMLRAERLTGQFVEGVAFGEGIFGGPRWFGWRLATWYSYHASGGGPASLTAANHSPNAPGGGAQEATTAKPGGRVSL